MSNEQMVSFPRELSDEMAERIARAAHVCGGGAYEIWEAICEGFGKPADQHQGELVPVTHDMHRLMEAYRLGEFRAEGGSDTVEALSVASYDAVADHGHDVDSYLAGFCTALYSQAAPFIWLAIKPNTHPDAGEVEQIRYKAELYDEVWELATGLGYMNVTTAISSMRTELESVRSSRDAFGQNAIDLRAQLAERDAPHPIRVLGQEAYSTLVGMVEYCLNKRVCLGMDEGYKNFLDEEGEHDFVKELRTFVSLSASAEPSEQVVDAGITASVDPRAPVERDEHVPCLNDWFLSLPEGRQSILRDDKWMLADAAFEAGYARAAMERKP